MNYQTALAFAREMRKNPTSAERVFWTKVRHRNFHDFKFYRQFIITHRTILGVNRYYIVDFYCAEKKLIVEIDGSIHHFQKEDDERREENLLALGHRIIRLPNNLVLSKWPSAEKELLEELNKL